MNLKQKLDQDLKQALLDGNKDLATTIRGLKSAILYQEVALGKRDSGLTDDEIIQVLAKEAKKRQESIDLYTSAGDEIRANSEEQELNVIQNYLPKQLTDIELLEIVKEVITAGNGSLDQKDMGRIIGAVKQRVNNLADGSRIASMVKEQLGEIK
jgi:uncharacterized protein